MNLLNLEHITKDFNGKTLLDDISAGVLDTDKIGIIGVNGCGKSTLLAIAAGEMEPDAGQVIKNGTLRISYLPQDPVFDPEKSLIENITARIYGKEEHWDVEGEARAMLIKFGIDDPGVMPGVLSGGQKKRAALVAALLTPANLLILDEPTNHLDHGMIEYLQDFLINYTGAVLLITHDRYFLDQVTNRILEIDKGKIYGYEGGYSRYLELRSQRLSDAVATERKLASLYRKDLAWIMRGARARSTKQKAHIQRFEALRDRERPIEEQRMQMQSLSSRLGGKTIELEDLGKTYGDRELFHGFSYNFGKLDRIGIIGPNGCGKSTLLKMILGLVEPTRGTIRIGQTVVIGYFGQENEDLPDTGRVIDAIKDKGEYVTTKDGQVSAARMCETFLFDSTMQYTPVSKLSGGEKRRLYLLQVLMTSPNVLILDEPTNDLDIQTLRVLEDYLDTFQGIVIVVSHDRYFLDRVVTRIFSFEPDKTLRQSEGGYEEYRQRGFASLAESVFTPKKAEQKTEKNYKPKNNKKTKLSYNEQREYDSIENEIDELTEKSEELARLIDENATNYGKLSELSSEKEKVDAEIEAKMERFIILQEMVDSFEKD